MLSEQILETLKYFDVQDHCLTLLEVWKLLLKGKDESQDGSAAGSEARERALGSIWAELQKLQAEQKVGQHEGFYFLEGRRELVKRRLQNNFYAIKRLKRIRRYLPLVRHVPFISAVALSGSEALANSKQGSDIDLFVLTQKNRMWLARICLTFFFQALGMRRHGNHIADRFCLNHYVVEDKILDSDKNLYNAVFYVLFIPCFGADKILEFQKRNLPWLKEYLHQPQLFEHKTPAASWFKKAVEALFANSFGNLLERIAQKYQMRRIKIQEYILVEPDELSFHPGSKGQQVLAKYRGI